MKSIEKELNYKIADYTGLTVELSDEEFMMLIFWYLVYKEHMPKHRGEGRERKLFNKIVKWYGKASPSGLAYQDYGTSIGKLWDKVGGNPYDKA